MASGVRSFICAGPGTTSESLPEAPEGWTKRPCGRTGGASAELLEQRSPKIRSCLNIQLRHSEGA
eukprot:15439092-Alexandrium_andersonii.AAC.1